MPRRMRRAGASERYEVEDPYPYLRAALAPEYANLPPEKIEAVIEGIWGPGVSAEAVEDIFGSIGSALGSAGNTLGSGARQAAPYVGPVLSGAAQGAATGSAFGPYGAIAGALLGGLGGGVSAAQQRPGQPAAGGSAPKTTPAMPSQPPAGMATSPQSAAPATGQLLALLSRPEVLQALMGMLMGNAGRPTVPVRNTAVPVEAFTNLIGVLANQATTEYQAMTAGREAIVPRYLMNAEGEFVVDPAVPEQRAGRLLELIGEAARQEALTGRRAAGRFHAETVQELRDEENYYLLELAEIYTSYEGLEE